MCGVFFMDILLILSYKRILNELLKVNMCCFFIDRLVILGYKRPLVREDLWSLNTEDTSAAVKEKYEKHWQAQVTKIKR